MIKTVIFDLDNTLLMWKDEYISYLIDVLKKIKRDYSLEKINLIDNKIDEYGKFYSRFDDNNFLNFINKECDTDFDMEFVDLIKEAHGSIKDKVSNKLENVLKYIKNKYYVIVLTNYFEDVQKNRLENARILKYIDEVQGGDKHDLKPRLSAFNKIKNHRNCVMIGDSLEEDINPALKLNMKCIWLTDDKKEIKGVTKIKSLIELKELL